ncbi:hypothetical protein [Micromonospora sp. NPDC047527]|uniref:hypothetical protein n=1 Tax=Micromonospora sp. NPDC047527 TaxID=3155144 RepID=UPI0033FFE21D
MKRLALLVLSVVAVLLSSTGSALGTDRAPDVQPRVALPEGTHRVGDRVLVALDGWPAGVVQILLFAGAGRRVRRR